MVNGAHRPTNAQKGLFLRLRRATADLLGGAEGLGDEITTKLAKSFGTTATEVMALAHRAALGDQSLDQPLTANGGTALKQTRLDALAGGEPNPEEALAEVSEKRFLSDMVGRALAVLPPREELNIRRRYFEDVRTKFEAIGREIGLSKDRVRQLEARALAKLREILQPALAGRHF